ncbi:MAG TPA: M48 family metallopeptidase [Woeseiaceae bacterium]|nr:M48 family metallopeptidase [Woeseiaceae bacterium]
MNFFDAQDRARRATRWLVVVYIVATALIVAGVTLIVAFALYSASNPGYGQADFADRHSYLLVITAIGTALFIFAASLYKTSMLSAGGGKVAASLGGKLVATDVSDPLRQRLRNVVEEIAIASGVPVPDIYVLEEESGINAFAAGFAPGDAAIAVTRGALELLDRDELQGVIAHEFSHILNGDMRLNIRLMGVLFGILALGLIGRMIMRGGYYGNMMSSRRDRGTSIALLVGIGLAVLGGIGVFFARLIKASISRQREFLADASAVQFTRQSTGIANALKKIGGYSQSSYLTAADPEEVSHMLFGTGARLFGMFATHPPLTARIKALDPTFDESRYPKVDPLNRQAPGGKMPGTDALGGLAAAFSSGAVAGSSDAIVDSVGNPENRHVEYASALRQGIPESLYDAAHSKDLAYLLAISLVLDRSGKTLPRQLGLLNERLGAQRARLVGQFANQLAPIDDRYLLPLLGVSFPALKMRPAAELNFLLELIRRLIEIDGHIDLFEYCFYRILGSNLGQSIDPPGRSKPGATSTQKQRMAMLNLLALVADHGHTSTADRDQAFASGSALLGDWAAGFKVEARREHTVAVLDQSLDTLSGLSNQERRRLLQAITTVATYDGQLTVTETELIRVVCAALACPLPPILLSLTA